jgi:hypothetical protein
VYSKWYRNSEHVTFTDVFKTFLQEAADAGAAIKVRVQLSLALLLSIMNVRNGKQVHANASVLAIYVFALFVCSAPFVPLLL